MNRVFGILLVGWVLAVGSASSPSIAGNWNQTDEVTIYGGKGITNEGWAIPFKAKPNYATAKFYLLRYLNDYKGFDRAIFNPSKKPKKLAIQPSSSKIISTEMNKSSLLSYLLYDKDKIVVDEITPRFDGLIRNDTQLYSMSIGKSLTSYLLGHAICEGYITGLDQMLNDWDVVQDTLYQNQKLIDLLNMSAGDQDHVTEKDGFLKSGRWFNSHALKEFTQNELKGTRSSFKKYNYNGLPPNIVFEYVIHKTGDEFTSFSNSVFQDHIGIQHKLIQMKTKRLLDGVPGRGGSIRATFFATRYDYLRLAIAMLDDWKRDGCMGKYLKEIHERRISKNASMPSGRKWQAKYWRGYGGFFHTDLLKMSDRHIMGMNGLGGQLLWIDFDNSRILALHTVHGDYDHNKIALRVIKGEEDLTSLLGLTKGKTQKTSIRTTKYDRTKAGMEMRFKCLTDFATANDINDLPKNQEIESLSANLEGNDYYRSKRQIVKAGISKEAMDANKAALVRLVNFEGTNEEYCAKPVL